MRNLLRRAAIAVGLLREPEMRVIQGTRPGYAWWPEGRRWVGEDETFRPLGRFYTLIGPVFLQTSGWLGPAERESAIKALSAKG